jgi:hypothetical protein
MEKIKDLAVINITDMLEVISIFKNAKKLPCTTNADINNIDIAISTMEQIIKESKPLEPIIKQITQKDITKLGDDISDFIKHLNNENNNSNKLGFELMIRNINEYFEQ